MPTIDLNELSRQVLESYLGTSRNPGELFWSVRDISRRFNCTEYVALEVLRKLTAERFIDRRPGKGSYLRGQVDMNLLALAVGCRHPGFVVPYWGGGSTSNLWTDFHQCMAVETHRLGWDATFFSDAADWGETGFAMKIKMARCNIIVAVDPGEAALITFTELRRDNIPVLVVGPPRKGYEKLGVVTLDGDEREAMRLVTLRLFKLGFKRPLVAGNSGRFSIQQRYDGLREAFQEAKKKEPGDIFLEEPSAIDQLVHGVQLRLKSTRPPDALIFNESVLLQRVLEDIPGLAEQAVAGLPLVAFDDLYISKSWPKVPIITVTIPMDTFVKETVRIIELLVKGQPVKPRYLIPRHIHWT